MTIVEAYLVKFLWFFNGTYLTCTCISPLFNRCGADYYGEKCENKVLPSTFFSCSLYFLGFFLLPGTTLVLQNCSELHRPSNTSPIHVFLLLS